MGKLLGFPKGSAPFVLASATSLAAATSLSARLSKLEEEVYACLAEAEPVGLTDEELEAATGLSHQNESARRRSLVLKGLVRDSGRQRSNATGRSATVWVLGQDSVSLGTKISRTPRPCDEDVKRALRNLQRAVKTARKHDPRYQSNDELRRLWRWLVGSLA